MESKMDISVIIPVLNEERNILPLYRRLTEVLLKLKKKYEIIFIDDGSKDSTPGEIKKIIVENKKVKLIQFRKNFGKSNALNIGFKEAKGKFIFTMDGDLQDDPYEIPRFLEALNKYDLVVGWKFRRKDPITKTIPSKLANYTTSKYTRVNIHDMNCGFKGYRSEVAKSLNIYGDMHRYIPALASAKGFRVGEIKVRHHKRVHGKSKYGFMRLFSGLFDFITILFLTKYSNKPLHFFGRWGLLAGLLGALAELYAIYLKLIHGEPFLGHITLITLGFILFIIGFQLVSLGLLGEMIIKEKKSDGHEVKEKIGLQ
jgi:glycosyltransferase involved in cell wall biosynthesis